MMINFNDNFSTPPPPMLVVTWLSVASKVEPEFEYSRNRAVGILNLLFGSIENAQAYVKENSGIEQPINDVA